jgi:hypothetical protein
MDTVSFTSKKNYIGFKDINFYIIFNAPILYRANIGL